MCGEAHLLASKWLQCCRLRRCSIPLASILSHPGEEVLLARSESKPLTTLGVAKDA